MAYLRSELKALRETYRVPREETQEFGRDYQNLLVLLPGSDEFLREEVNLDRREAFQMNRGPDAFEPAQELLVPLERQIGMKAIDDVNLGDGLALAVARDERAVRPDSPLC